MARRRRMDWPGAWHHVMHRASGRRLAFRNDADRLTFVALLSQIEDRFGVEVHCYCLMGNHFHLLVRSADGRLSEAMQWLLAGYTRSANAHRGVDGAIFRGRFHSVAADQPAHRFALVPYILANPIDLPWPERLEMYPWSSLGALVAPDRHRNVNRWLQSEVVRGMYDVDDLVRAVENRRSAGTTTSSLDVLASIRDRADVVTWRDLVRAVESGRFVTGDRVSDGAAKAAAVLLAVDGFGWARSDVEHAAGISASGLRSTLARARTGVRGDETLCTVVEFAVDVLEGVPAGV